MIARMGAKNTQRIERQAKLLTLQTASTIYGPPYTSLRDLVVNGYLASVRLPGSRRIWVRRDDLERLIQQSVECRRRPQITNNA